MAKLQPDQRLMRGYFEAAIALMLALVLLPISGLQSRDFLADALAIAFALYVGWLTVRARRVNGPQVILFSAAAVSLALFMLSVAVGPQLGTPGAGNWLFPEVSFLTGGIALCANVALYWKARNRGSA